MVGWIAYRLDRNTAFDGRSVEAADILRAMQEPDRGLAEVDSRGLAVVKYPYVRTGEHELDILHHSPHIQPMHFSRVIQIGIILGLKVYGYHVSSLPSPPSSSLHRFRHHFNLNQSPSGS